MVRWAGNGVRGFGSKAAAQQFIDSICMTVAPEHEYKIEKEF